MQCETAFSLAMQRADVIPPDDIIDDGHIHRFSTKNARDKNGWYAYHDDYGAFGDWSREIHETWHAVMQSKKN